MTKEEFLRKVAIMDLKQGNFKETEKWMEKRKRKLDSVSDQYLEFYEYLLKEGYKVHVYEMLTPKGCKSEVHRMSHMYIPELECSVRFMPPKSDGFSYKKSHYLLNQYVHFYRPYCRTFVVEPQYGLEWLKDKLEEIRGYNEKQGMRIGIENEKVFPARGQRRRVAPKKISEKVEVKTKHQKYTL